MAIDDFIQRWSASSAAERANKDAFLIELCDVLDVPHPSPTTGDPAKDTYVFERDALLPREGGTVSVGKIDLYRAEAFILEAKQGSFVGSKKVGTAKRETPAWHIAMRDAYGQALGYARSFEKPVPFLVICDIGYCFDLYAAFDGSGAYHPFPDPQSSRLFFRDLPRHKDTLRQVFLDPHALDPSKRASKVTREVATYLANLGRKLEDAGHPQELVAKFLMRCLFTMFAEDVGLLPAGVFTHALREFWIPSPRSFPTGVEQFWRTMNNGGALYTGEHLLRFNGGLFENPTSLPLDEHALRLLLMAAECQWHEVEPAIFGTLLERALDPKERHRLGAHYTPRAYVERLIRPTIEEPLRAEWKVVQAQVRTLVLGATGEDEVLTEAELRAQPRMPMKAKRRKAGQEGARTKKLNEAKALLLDFHKKLTSLRVLDPACGSGNFLYVTLDVFKRLEAEVFAALEGLGVKNELLQADSLRVTPAQFLGIEVKRWAKEIAELVLWIGYLQWHFRAYGKTFPVPEPVLRDYQNIECRDAILAYDREELLLDDSGKPVMRWDGETMKASPVTGRPIPDETAEMPVYRYVNPRRAEWPQADFIVGNPPFIGSKRMLGTLGEGYVAALRKAYADVPDGTDYVLYWWVRAATTVAGGLAEAAGLITTNSITQSMNRRIIESTLRKHPSIRLIFVIADHPWVDSADGAAVRIAMNVVAKRDARAAFVHTIIAETSGSDGEVTVTTRESSSGVIHSDFTAGPAVVSATPLKANRGMCSVALVRFGEGFIVDPVQRSLLEPSVLFPLLTGRDVNQSPEEKYVIDFFPLDEHEARKMAPKAFQYLAQHVRPAREQIRDAASRKRWWRFGRDKPALRAAIHGLTRYIATSEVSKHRVFSFFPAHVRPDHTLVVLPSADAFDLGVVSSRCHTAWAAAAGGRMGVGNDLRYNRVVCFDPFPFPVCGTAARKSVRDLAESLDTHRKRQQAQHPMLTMTGMYNILEKLRSGETFNDKDRTIHEQGLVSVLKQIHDALDKAVFDAYGWPSDLTDEQILEKLVALNAERAEEEKNGVIRWLRPDFQNPAGKKEMAQVSMAHDAGDGEADPGAAANAARWPQKLSEQVTAVRDIVTKTSEERSLAEVVKAFKEADPEEVQEVLDSLVALGLVVAYELPEGWRWRASKFVG